MTINISSNISSLNQINSSLNNTSKDKDLSKTVSNLSKVLVSLENNIKEGFTPLTEILRSEAIKILHQLDQTIENCNHKNIDINKIQTIKNKILNIETALVQAPLLDKREILSPDIKSMAFFCDLESPDHNEAIWSMLKDAIVQNVPFVTTRSLIRGTGYSKQSFYDKDIKKIYKEREQFLFKEQGNWDIFQKGEMLVFMPKTHLPDLPAHAKLEAHDLKVDASLLSISMAESLQGPEDVCNIDSFIDLFVEEPKTNKIIHLAGHGYTDMVGALKFDQFGKFLNFLENQRCKGLSIMSCFSGGESFLQSMPDVNTDTATNAASFFTQDRSHKIATLVRSVGDFVAYTHQTADSDLKGFLNVFASYISSSKGQTFNHLKHKIEELEKNKGKRFTNLMQFYPAHGPNTPVGPRALGEGDQGFLLTYAVSKRAEIAANKPFNAPVTKTPAVAGQETAKKEPLENKQVIEVKNSAKLLQIYPLVVNSPIKFMATKSSEASGQNPILLSQGVGSSHHFIKKIDFVEDLSLAEKMNKKNLDASTYLDSVVDFHNQEGYGLDSIYGASGLKKSFFIESTYFPQSEGNLQNIVLFISPNKSYFIAKNEDGYLAARKNKGYSNDFSYSKIGPLSFGILSYETALTTQSSAKALRAMSAGQESEELFIETIQAANYFPEPFLSLFKIENNSIKCVPDFLNVISSLKMDKPELENTIAFLLKHGHSDLAFQLAEKEHLTNPKDFHGNTLLDLAIQADDPDSIKRSLEYCSLDSNLADPSGKTPLQVAICRLKEAYNLQEKGMLQSDKILEKRKQILDLLLAHPSINPEVKSSELRDAFPNREIVLKLLDKGAKIGDYFEYFVGKQDSQSVDMLIELGATPSSSAALEKAAYFNDFSLVQKLLSAGAKVTIEVLNESILRSSPKIVELLLANNSYDLKDTYLGETPMFAALLSGNKKKIDMLKARQAPLQKVFYNKEALTGIFERWLVTNDQLGLSEHLLLQEHFNLTCEWIAYLLKNDFTDLFTTLINRNEIDVNRVENDSAGATLENTSILHFIMEHTSDQNLIQICFDKIVDFNTCDLFNTLVKHGQFELVKIAFEQKGAKLHEIEKSSSPLQSTDLTTELGQQMFKWLIDNGADLNVRDKDGLTPLCHVIASGNLDLVMYCLNKGVNMSLEYFPSYLASAASQKGRNSSEIFKYLFTIAEADINVPTPAGTLFATLVSRGDLELVKWALEQGANVNSAIDKELGVSLINLAAERSDDHDATIVKQLIQAGADSINLSEKAIKNLIQYNDKEILEYCYNHGAAQIIKENTLMGIRASLTFKNADLLQFFLDKCPINSFYSERIQKNLGELAAEGNLVMLKKLFAKEELAIGPKTEIEIAYDSMEEMREQYKHLGVEFEPLILYKPGSFFECAIKAKPSPQKEIIRFLLKHDDDPHQRIDGAPAIYFAVNLGDPELIKMLIDRGAGADIHEINEKTGLTALELARNTNDPAIIALFESF